MSKRSLTMAAALLLSYFVAGIQIWKLLYSFRKKRIKGLTDCDKFMERVSKATQEQPSRASGLLAAQRNPGNSN